MVKLAKIADETLHEIADMLKAMSDPTRLKIIQSLHDGELCVSDIVEQVGTGQANISKHLQILSKNNLLKSRREGNIIYYQLYGAFINQLCETVCRTYQNIITKKFGVKS